MFFIHDMIKVMKKSTLIIIASLFLVLGGVGGYFIISARNKTSQPVSKESGTTKETVLKADLTYKDESGFSFGYPKGIKITDVTPEDDNYYTQLELAKGNESLTITVKDAKEDSYQKLSLVGATSLGDLPAKQYTQDGKLITAAFQDGILYSVEGLKDGSFWENTQNLIVSSFTLAKPTTSDSSDENTVYEGEETVE